MRLFWYQFLARSRFEFLSSILMDASSSSHPRCTYDVFLSFRGEDTRRGFTDHLYKALDQSGIHTFRDDDEIPRGTKIQQQLEKAIQESRLSVVVFSKDYASSRWCLDELVKITQRTKTDGIHIIIPVFYDVDPSDVRKQTGPFSEAFSKHEERFKEEMDKVEEWRRALRDVPDLAGMVLGDRYESEFIQDLVEEIGNKLDRKALYVAPYAVGIDRRVRPINKWLKDGSDDVGIAVICGMGGIGKTTIAKTAYNQNFDSFEGSSFLADVRQISEQRKGLLDLQRQLLSDIQKRKAKKIFSPHEGIEKIKGAVSCKRVLIVVDDVDDTDQLRAILGDQKCFHPGSKIIITTRDGHLLKGHQAFEMFEVEGLYLFESLELFSWHAFQKTDPLEDFVEISIPLVKDCEGLPLALQVLGSFLYGKGLEIWQDALHNLDVITEGKIEKILRISFDSLQFRDKSLFLHLACFFIRQDKDFIIAVLDNCGFSTRIELQNLVHRCLVRFNEGNKLFVHELLRDMAMDIICQESPEDPGKRSRVLHKDAINILRKLTGTEAIKGLMLNLPPVLMEGDSSKTTFASNKKRGHIEDYNEGNDSRRRRLDFFSWQPINLFSRSSGPVSDEIGFKSEAFTRMNNLEILVLNNVKFSGGYEHFPKSLVWLSWNGFPEESIPENFSLAYVVALHLENSSLRHVWKETALLPRLKILNLSHSHGLMRTPDFSLVPNLERLVLKYCVNLVEVDESIGDLKKLVLLNLKNCKNLMMLPRSIGMMQSLQTLVLSGCSKLVDYDHNAIATNHQLQSSNLKNISLILTNFWQSIRPWPVSSRKIVDLTRFSLVDLPNCLSSLNLANCNLSEISSDVCFPPSLKNLNLSGNPIMRLPENMNRLIKLQALELNYCTELRTLPELPPSLKSLRAFRCRSLKRITNLPNIFTSMTAQLRYCEELAEVQSSFIIIPLGSIGLELSRHLGLFDVESVRSSSDDELVEMKNFLTTSTRKLLPQVLYECGIFSTFRHGTKIPEFFSYKSIGESVLSITLMPNSHDDLDCKIRGINACVLYGRRRLGQAREQFLKVSNESKGLMWTYCPVTIGVPQENEDMLWLSHWLFGNKELEVGDTIHVSVESDHVLAIEEFGIQIVYHEDDFAIQPETMPTSSSSQNVDYVVSSVSALPQYQLQPGKYFLSNHWHHSAHQQQFSRGQMKFASPLQPFEYKQLGYTRYLFKHKDNDTHEDGDSDIDDDKDDDDSGNVLLQSPFVLDVRKVRNKKILYLK